MIYLMDGYLGIDKRRLSVFLWTKRNYVLLLSPPPSNFTVLSF